MAAENGTEGNDKQESSGGIVSAIINIIKKLMTKG